MANTNFFLIEIKDNLYKSDFIVLRTLYMPLIGKNATILYTLLHDYHSLNSKSNFQMSLEDLIKNLDVSMEEFIKSRQKLEAVGLLRTFSNANKSTIFIINKPLSPIQLRQNNFLYDLIKTKVSDEIFERLCFSQFNHKYDKEDYFELTSKFHDIFSIKDIQTKESKNDISYVKKPSKDFESVEQAMHSISPNEFVEYVSHQKISKTLADILNYFSMLGFSKTSLNAVINYSFQVNKSIVNAHIKTILMDLYNKGLKSADEIKNELNNALFKKENELNQKQSSEKIKVSWDSLFASFGGEF